ncbi:MAG: hypothetical protein RLZZ450_4807 [Pseudomonadota bacterium]|jgi:hypothetical protein
MLLSADDRPSLFIRPEPDAALIGYVAEDVALELAGSIEQGRVPVRIEGALRARGYVAQELLRLRVQRRGRVRGTPVYLGPGDRVRVLGNEPGAPDRLRVEVIARMGPRVLGRYEGSFPSVGLAARAPEASAEAPDPGIAYQVPAGLEVPLFELPGGPLVAQLSAQPVLSEVRVISEQEGWLAVRAGSGPFLIGWTQVALHKVEGVAAASLFLPTAGPSTSAAPAAATEATSSPSPADANSRGVPARLINEPGQLRRVAAHSKVVFGEQVIGVFKTEGWARVIHTYDSGFADVFAAADNRLAIRGLMRTSDLLPVQAAMPEAATPMLTEGAPAQVWQPAAPTAPASEPVAQDVPPTAPPPVSPTPAPELAPAPAPSFVPAPVIAPVPLPETLAPTTR